MINKLMISGLKSIDEITINCSNLNLLLGINSTGKSTVLQSILLLAQNADELSGANGPMVSLGEYREIKNYNINKSKIEIQIEEEKEIFGVTISEDSCCNSFSSSMPKLKEKMDYVKGHVKYLSCNRIGSRDIYGKDMSSQNGVGINGEYAVDVLRKKGNRPVPMEICASLVSFTLNEQVNYWLKYIMNANVMVEDILGTDSVKAAYSLVKDKYSRPKNVGSGISFIISIIVMCLDSEKEDALLIENPEIHLHPLAQSRLCEFLYFIGNSERQLFIETHSDHIFNGIRAGIAQNTMNEEKVNINFFDMNEKNCTECHEVKFGKYGKILNPVKNLFDQFEIDLDKMLGIE